MFEGWRKPIYVVIIDGNDFTSRFRPLVKSIRVSKKAKQSSHTAEILLADPEGIIALPTDESKIQIHLGHEGDGADVVFEGTVNDVNSRGGKGSGSELTISANSADQKGKIKQQILGHKDDATFADVAREWGGKAGLGVEVLGSLAQITRPYWIIQSESFQAWGQRMAAELGATFQVIGERAFFSPRNEGISATGAELTPVIAARFRNLKVWDISPLIGRPQYQSVRTRYYDRETAQWMEETVEVRGGAADVQLGLQTPEADQSTARDRAASSAKESEREKGSGTVVILGDYAAEPEATCIVSGTRPGVDGEYTIDAVDHSVTKKGGFETTLTIKKPSGEAGKDTR
ncbi:MAG: late control D family protein [Salinarimonadaceae bacterium]|nr:MAG: late control D family protein [Salinarimonadaceae bacterium]